MAAPAIAQSLPEIRWRLQSVVPKSVDVIFGTLERFSQSVAAATDGRFKIQVYAAGEIVGPLAALDAASNGTVEAAHSAFSYSFGKAPAFAIMSYLPFGFNARSHNAWLFEGGGNELVNTIARKHNLYALPGGNTGEQMGGWFRREIKSLADIKGLRFRIPGLGGEIFSRMGATPQLIPASDVYPSLERGTIDGAEFLGPHDDEKMGLGKVAPFYHYPSFWESSSVVHLMMNLQKWEELPKLYKDAVALAATDAHVRMLMRYDMVNPAALRRIIASGAQLRPFPQDVFDAGQAIANDLYKEYSARDPDFKAIYDSQAAVKDDMFVWHQIAESSYTNMAARARGRR